MSASLVGGIYTLDFDLASFNGEPDYTVELLAGGAALVSGSSLTLAHDIWQTSTVEVGIPTGHPQLGELLEIRISKGAHDDGAELLADNVRLGYVVPEPATIMLLALGTTVVARRKRKHSTAWRKKIPYQTCRG